MALSFITASPSSIDPVTHRNHWSVSCDVFYPLTAYGTVAMAVAARVATQRSEREIVLHWYSCNREKYYVKDATAGFLSQAANENPSTGMRECFKEEEERERGRIREKRSRARKDASLQRLRGLRLSWPGQLVTTTSNCIRMSESIYMPRMLFLVKSNPKQSHEVSSLTLCKLNFARLLFWPE